MVVAKMKKRNTVIFSVVPIEHEDLVAIVERFGQHVQTYL